LVGAVPDYGPMREPEWSALPKGRRARLTGAACGLKGVDWGFRSKPITDSGPNRSLIPVQTDH